MKLRNKLKVGAGDSVHLSTPQSRMLLYLASKIVGDRVVLSPAKMRHLMALEDKNLVEVCWERKLGTRDFSASNLILTSRGRRVVKNSV
jgi:hypothetical protein